MTTVADAVIGRLAGAPKYRAIHPDTIADVVRQENAHVSDRAELERRVRLKLHRVAAGYLFTARPAQLVKDLDRLPDDDPDALRSFCRSVLAAHSSSAERRPDQDAFYTALFAAIGPVAEVADIACALNPFSLPWLRDVSDARYVGYDLNLSYVDLGRKFLDRWYPDGQVHYRDVLIDPASITADAALLLKTYHSIEERRTGAGLRLVDGLGTPTVVVSFPMRSLKGRPAPLWRRQIEQIEELAAERGWDVHRSVLGTEELVTVRKGGTRAAAG